MNRRRFLARTGATLGLGALAGCALLDGTGSTEPSEPVTLRDTKAPTTTTSGRTEVTTESERTTPVPTPEAPLTRHGIDFETVHHAVDDLGMDPTGEEPIDDALDAAYGDRTLVVFPPGRYLAREPHVWNDDVAGFGMLGLGKTKSDVEFVFPKGNRGAPDPANYWFLRVESGREHLLENVTIQQTDDMVTGVGTVFYQEDGLQVHDVEVAGFNPAYDHDPGFAIVAAITTRDGVGVVEGFTCTDGGVVDLYPKRKIPIASYRNHVGELRIHGAHIANSGEHSMYVSRMRGCVRVEDGLFVNNDNSNLRLSGGGHPTKRSWAKNCRIVVDTENAANLPDGERYQGARGIWVEAGGEYEYGHSDLLLEDVTVVARSNARPAVLLLVEHSHGAVTVRDCSFRSHVEGATVVDARFPFRSFVEGPYGVTLENVSVATSATETSSGFAAVVESRPESLVRDVDVQLVPGEVNGLLLSQADRTRVFDTDVTAQPSEWCESVSDDLPDVSGQNVGVVVADTSGHTIRNLDARVPGQAVETRERPAETESANDPGD